MSQTWRNGCKGDEPVAKRLDKFLIEDKKLGNIWIIKSSVLVGGVSDHMHILLNISKSGFKPPSPLNFNQNWLKENDYMSLIADSWVHLCESSGCSFMQQITNNLAKVKHVSSSWSRAFNLKNISLLREVECRLADMLINRPIDTLENKKKRKS
jgi:hypothetical protein